MNRHADRTPSEEQGSLVSPVDHIPGHGQHASHPGAAHHPATHKQRSHIDGLKAKDHSNVKVDWLHEILEKRQKCHVAFELAFKAESTGYKGNCMDTRNSR